MKPYKIKSILLILFIIVLSANSWAGESFKGIPDFKGENKEYIAKKGEGLYPIARRNGFAIEHLMFANGMKGIKTKVGQKVLIPIRRIPPLTNVKNGLVLNLPERGIYLFKNGEVIKFYPVAIGATGKWMTPTGDMKIISKVKNPIWFPPEWAKEETPVAAGPNNPLGDRWMGLDRPGYGIHATNNPSSIGLAASHGCIRMYPELAQDLFKNVKVGMPVKIVYEPVKIGYDTQKKHFFLEVYPDVYNKTLGLLNFAEKKLADVNLLGLIDKKRLKMIVSRKRGKPELILGSNVIIKIDGKKQNFSFSPIRINGRIWALSEILPSIGAKLAWDEDKRVIEICRDKKKVKLKVINKLYTKDSDTKEGIAYLWHGKSFIPLSYVFKNLGIKFNWYKKEEVVYISSEHTDNNIKKNGENSETIISNKKYFLIKKNEKKPESKEALNTDISPVKGEPISKPDGDLK